MSKQSPRVSIGLPVYNGERYVACALESLLAQTYLDFELIISDNASTDATEAICRKFAASDSRIRYHREQENRGAIWNFNRAFELSRGEYFKWAASDDICHATFLARCVETLDADTGLVWCHSQSAKIDEQGDILTIDPEAANGEVGVVHTSEAGHPREHHDSQQPSQRLQGVLLGTTWSADSYGLARADALRSTRMLLPCYGAEKVLIGELSLLGRYREIPETLFFQRVHAGASGSLRSAKDQQLYMIPKSKNRFAATRARLLGGYLRAVMRTPMSRGERCRCTLAIVRYLFQTRKWLGIARGAIGGVGLGKHNVASTSKSEVSTNGQSERDANRGRRQTPCGVIDTNELAGFSNDSPQP